MLYAISLSKTVSLLQLDMFCWFISQISDIGIALTTTSHQQPEVTPVIRFKI
jgi:hypothetical protein